MAFSRNYQLFMLLTFVLCALWQHRRFSFLWSGVLLGLLCLTHVFGDILAGGLGVMLLVDAVATREGRAAIRGHAGRFVGGILVAFAGAGAAVKVMIPPPDSGYKPEWWTAWDLERMERILTDFWSAYVPIPSGSVHFWDTNMVSDGAAQVRWGLALAAFFLVCLCVSWRAVLFFLIVTVGSLAFFYLKLFGGTRHHGVLFVALIGAFWIAWVARRPVEAARAQWWRWTRAMLWFMPRVALGAMLGVQVYAAVVMCERIWQRPFTPGKQAAALIEKNLRPGDILASGNQIITTSVAAYLPGRLFYFPLEDRWGTFTLWDSTPWEDLPTEEVVRFLRKQKGAVIFIRCWNRQAIPGGKLLGRFGSGIEPFEMYSVYRVEAGGVGRD